MQKGIKKGRRKEIRNSKGRCEERLTEEGEEKRRK